MNLGTESIITGFQGRSLRACEGLPAESLAVLRSFADIPYAEDIAVQSKAKAILQSYFKTTDKMYEFIRCMAPFFELRFKSVTNLTRLHGTKHIIELAAGLSTRGLLMTDDDPKTLYIETDLKQEVARKKRLISNLRQGTSVSRENLILYAVDVLDYTQLIGAAQYLRGPITVVSEGLLLWNGICTQKRIAANIRSLLLAFGGIWITPDLVMGERQLRGFLADTGFTHIETFARRDLAGALVSIKRLGLNEDSVLAQLSGRKLHLLAP
jgi:hypothetical protein